MLVQQGQLDIAPAQLGEPMPALGAEAGEPGADRIEPVDFGRLRLALELPLAERRGIDEALHHVERRPGDAYRARMGRGLETRGDIHCVAERAIGHGLAFADLADDCGPGMDADAQQRLDPIARLELVLQAIHALLNVERGAAGSERGILHGDRRAEHRHEFVAGEILHHPAIRLDGLTLLAGDTPCQRKHGFLAEAFAHDGEVHQIGEHDGQVATLAVERRARAGLPCHRRCPPEGRLCGFSCGARPSKQGMPWAYSLSGLRGVHPGQTRADRTGHQLR